MSVEILIERDGHRLMAALLLDGRLQDLALGDDRRPGRTDSIHVGRVTQVTRRAGFVALEGGVEGYLNLRGPDRPQPGESLMVQVASEGDDGKSPKLTRDIALVHGPLVLTPGTPRLWLSHKIAPARQPALRAALEPLLADPDFEEMGLIARAPAGDVPPDMLSDLARDALESWHGMLAQFSATPTCLLPAPDAGGRILRDWAFAHGARVTLAGYDLPAAEPLPPGLPILHDKPGLFAARGLDLEIATLARPRVDLPGGAWLYITPTEALTVVDVNSGPRTDILGVNLDAATEAARQLRLRNLGGMVVVDFIRLGKPVEKDRLKERLDQVFDMDRASLKPYGFSRMGLFELTRQRRGHPTAAILALEP